MSKMDRVLRKFQPLKLPMIQNSWGSILLHLIFWLVFDHVEAQTIGPDMPSPIGGNFKPSLAIIIGTLCVVFALTFVILICAKFCHRRAHAEFNLQNHEGLIGRSSRFSGIDKTVIESLPFFRFSSLKGSKEGLECAVCLSKFEDIEILRMLPKCKHAFHIDCIDHWFEKHSSCPLCRHKISTDDLKLIANYSNSMRFLLNSNSQSELREEPNCNLELFVQREGGQKGSSIFSIGSSFRKIDQKGDFNKEVELLIQEENEDFHKQNHKIIVSDFVFNNRWSSVSSSDLMFLNSEMLLDVSSNRFTSLDFNKDHQFLSTRSKHEQVMNIKEEMEIKRLFESRVIPINRDRGIPISISEDEASSSTQTTTTTTSRFVTSDDQIRSMSEIIGLSRNGKLGLKNRLRESCLEEKNVKEDTMRRVWLPIARRTVQWFANREKRSEMLSQYPRQHSFL